MFQLSDYTLGERLYFGVSSVVYRARRNSDGAVVVIKLLHSDHPSRGDVARYEHEFRVLSALTSVSGPAITWRVSR